MDEESKKIGYKKPKKVDGAREKHVTGSTEYRVFQANQDYGVPASLIADLTGMTKTEVSKVIEGDDGVPASKLAAIDRFILSIDIAADLHVLPTTDYGIIKNIMAMCYTIANLENDLANGAYHAQWNRV